MDKRPSNHQPTKDRLISATILTLILFGSTFIVIGQESAEKAQLSGVERCAVRLKVELLKTAKVGKVELSSSTCKDQTLTERAIDAAKKITFEPQIVDGGPITVTKSVEYTFAPSDDWPTVSNDPKANDVLHKAITALGGNRYLWVKSQIGRGKFSVIKEGATVSFQTFVDVIVFPDKERTEFKERGTLTVQTNSGGTGWVYDGEQEVVKVQNETQLANFKQGMRTSLDNLLRGAWRGDADLSYIGRRPAALGKRNDAIKLSFKDGFVIEFEFSADDGLPQRSLYKKTTPEGEEVKEEDRYAQFVDIDGIKTPFIIDHVTNGKPTSRINYETVEFNKSIPDSIFTKPATPKEAKKEFKL